MSMRAARTAGNTPPAKPMSTEKAMPEMATPGLRTKVKASSEKVWKFMVEMVKNCMKEARKRPTQPPMSPRKSASNRKAARMLLRWNPKARSVPISAVLVCDGGVHGDHGADGRAEGEDDGEGHAEDAEEFRHHLRLLQVVAGLLLDVDGEPRVRLPAAL